MPRSGGWASTTSTSTSATARTRTTPLEETLRALDDIVTQGKVLYVGVSMWPAELLDEAHRLHQKLNLDPIVSNQPEYSMLHARHRGRRAARLQAARNRPGRLLADRSRRARGQVQARASSLPQAPARATAGRCGFMERFMRDDVLAPCRISRPIADELGITMAQMAIAWVLREPGVSSAIVGASRPEQVDENVAASGIELPPETLEPHRRDPRSRVCLEDSSRRGRENEQEPDEAEDDGEDDPNDRARLPRHALPRRPPARRRRRRRLSERGQARRGEERVGQRRRGEPGDDPAPAEPEECRDAARSSSSSERTSSSRERTSSHTGSE